MKKIICVVLCVFLTATFWGCGGKEEFDPETYVKGVLDTAYHCDVKDYVKQTGVKKSEAEETHMEFSKNSGIRLAAYFGIEADEDMVLEYQDICEQLYQEAVYEVKSAKKTEKGYEVVVEFRSENFIHQVEEQLGTVQANYQKALANKEEGALETYEEGLLETMAACLDNREWEDSSATILLVETEAGGFEIESESLNAFHQSMYGF